MILERNDELKGAKFVARVLRDDKLLKTFVKFSNRVRHPRVTGYMLIVGGSLTALPFVNKEIALAGVIICYIMGPLMMAIGLFRHYIGYRMLKANPATKLGEEFTYIFSSSGVKVDVGGEIEHLGNYSNIYRLWEDEKRFYIGTESEDLIILPKETFELGDVSEFKEFIIEKSKAIYTWAPLRADNIVKNNILMFKLRMKKQREEVEQEESK